jgi:hypothetical protein
MTNKSERANRRKAADAIDGAQVELTVAPEPACQVRADPRAFAFSHIAYLKTR